MFPKLGNIPKCWISSQAVLPAPAWPVTAFHASFYDSCARHLLVEPTATVTKGVSCRWRWAAALTRTAAVPPWQRGTAGSVQVLEQWPSLSASTLQPLHSIGCRENGSTKCQVKRKRDTQMVPIYYASNYETQIFLEVTLVLRHLTTSLCNSVLGLM